MRELTYREAIREALRQELQRDPNVFLMGEDIGLMGGAFAVTKGLIEEFGPQRILDAPLSEAVIAGAGTGAAAAGTRPVIEIMYIDFMTFCMDEIVNQAAKMRYMFGGKIKVPLTVRTQGGTGAFCAAQHSQSLEAWFVHVPGLKVVMPATPADAKGLLASAVRDDNVVIFIEHKDLYNTRGPVPEGEYLVPMGKAKVVRPGGDATIVSWSRMALRSLQAAEQLAGQGVDVEVIDLRSLSPMDMPAVLESVRKTGRLLVVEEGCRTGGVGAEISAQVMEKAFDSLDGPVVRLAGRDAPIPFSPTLEQASVPDVGQIVQAVRSELMGMK
jgi:pyruvate/2-oxoglutarate/acetoin dehydrogenase E1 component